jgi:hypothetical protein
MPSNTKINHVILIMIDDLRATHLFDLISKERLPNMANLSKNGIYSQNCVTSYPSITYPCYSNILTGSYSGYYPKEGSGIPLYHYVRRADPPTKGKSYPKIINFSSGLNRLNRELDKNCKTIFEQAGEGNFMSSLNLISRGSKTISPYPFTTESVLKNVEKAFKNPNVFFTNNEPPKITVAYVPATDNLMHNKGYDHPDYINEIIKCDKGIGEIIQILKGKGYYESTAIAIISDHGNYKAKHVYDLASFFKEKGLIQYQPKKGTGDFDCNFGSVGFFNFPGDDWHHHPTHEQLKHLMPSTPGKKKISAFEMLWKIPGVKFMYYRDDDCTPDKGLIHVEFRKEKSEKIYHGVIDYEKHGIKQKTKYTFESIDLYGYEASEPAAKLNDSKFHDIDEWLRGTNDLDFPMIVDQVPRYLKNPRSCDIFISTLGEYGFGYEHGKTVNDHPYSHDIGLRESMIVPFIIGGSSAIPSMEMEFCKTTDMVPTLLELLGISPDRSTVGKSVLNY